MTFRRLLKVSVIGVVGLVIGFGFLYQFFGLRIVMRGSGMPTLQFVTDAETQAAIIAEHRASQRDQLAAPASAGAEPATMPAEAPQDAPADVPSDPVVPTPAPANPPYWTDFFGPQRNGEYRELPIRTNWPREGLTPLWKQPVGGGYASFTIAHGRAFTIEQRGSEEVVAAYDVATGRELWTNSWRALFQETMGGDGPRATPTWSDGTVYALGAQGEFRALDDATGQLRWRTNILQDASATNVIWGMSAAPLIVGDTVVVLPGGTHGHSVVAYNRRTGTIAWAALNDRAAYSSPMLVTIAGTRQLLVLTAERLAGLAPDAGTVLWEFPWETYNDITVAQPLVLGNGRIFVSSGYGTGAAAIEVSAAEARFSVREVWRNTRMKNKFTSSVLHEGFIYGLDEAIMACIDQVTGELKWKGGRYGYGQILLASGHIIVLTEDGELALVRAVPERHEEIARFPVLNGKTWNHPAMDSGYLFVRNLAEMAAFDLRRP